MDKEEKEYIKKLKISNNSLLIEIKQLNEINEKVKDEIHEINKKYCKINIENEKLKNVIKSQLNIIDELISE